MEIQSPVGSDQTSHQAKLFSSSHRKGGAGKAGTILPRNKVSVKDVHCSPPQSVGAQEEGWGRLAIPAERARVR